MRNARTGMVVVASVVLVLLVGLALKFSDRDRRQSAQASPSAGPVASRPQSSSPPWSQLGRPEAPGTTSETPEQAAVDFDWRSVLQGTNAPPRLPRTVVEKYLDQHHRNAANLLAAYHALADTNYLSEAATHFPNDPRVQLSVLARDAFPEERRQWLDQFKASSPDNSLANYLSAQDYFKSGQTPAAIQELLEATRKPGFQDYVAESRLGDEELNLEAGRSALQSRFTSGWAEDLLPEMATLKKVAQDLAGLEKQYLAAGDSPSAEHLGQMGLGLAQRLNGGDGAKFAIKLLVGNAAEAIVLGPLDPDTRYDFLGGKTPKDISEEFKQQKTSLRALSRDLPELLSNLTEAELLSYTDREQLFGEVEAMRWLQARHGSK